MGQMSAETSTALLQVSKMVYSYPSSAFSIGPLDLEFAIGVSVVRGENGSGKSTLLNLLAGNLIPTEGQIYMRGHSVTDEDLRESVGFMASSATVFEYLTVREHYEFMTRLTTGAKTWEAVGDFALPASTWGMRAGALSLGQRQRLSFQLAVLGDPEVLVMDEPFNGVDEEGIEALCSDLTGRSQRGLVTVVAAHRPPVELAPVVASIDLGRPSPGGSDPRDVGPSLLHS